jgi:hypothetical protein
MAIDGIERLPPKAMGVLEQKAHLRLQQFAHIRYQTVPALLGSG